MMQTYKCPRDGCLLLSSKQNISAYSCTSCKGLLVELDKSKSSPLRKLKEIPSKGVSELACPVSGDKMFAIDLYGAEVDYSPMGRVVWLDFNEYETIINNWLKDTTYKPPVSEDELRSMFNSSDGFLPSDNVHNTSILGHIYNFFV